MIDLREQRAYLAEEYDPDDPDVPSELELVYRSLANLEAENNTLQAEVAQYKREITRLKELTHQMAWREKTKDDVIERLRELLSRLADIGPTLQEVGSELKHNVSI